MQITQVSQGQIDGLLTRVKNLYADISLVNDQMQKKITFLSGSRLGENQETRKEDSLEGALISQFHDALRHFEDEVRRTVEIADRLNEL